MKTELERLRTFARMMLDYPAHDWQRRAADIALHGWPKETGGAQTPAVAAAMERDWERTEAQETERGR